MTMIAMSLRTDDGFIIGAKGSKSRDRIGRRVFTVLITPAQVGEGIWAARRFTAIRVDGREYSFPDGPINAMANDTISATLTPVVGIGREPPPRWLQGLVSWMSSFVTNKGFDNNTAAWHAYASRPKYIGWGTGSGQNASDNDLASVANESRTNGTSSQQTTNVTNDTYQVTGTLTAGGARAITEAALFDAAGSSNPPSGGNMGVYGDFSVINLATNDSIAFTFQVVES